MNNSKARLALVSILVALGGCTTAQPIMTSNGQQGFAVDCSAMGMTQCYQKAGQLCGTNGYHVLNSVDKRSGFFTSAENHMVIACKKPSSPQGR